VSLPNFWGFCEYSVSNGKVRRLGCYGSSILPLQLTCSFCLSLYSTGSRGKIQASESTAALLIEAGKGHWIKARPDPVAAKGKGMLQTYFVSPS